MNKQATVQNRFHFDTVEGAKKALRAQFGGVPLLQMIANALHPRPLDDKDKGCTECKQPVKPVKTTSQLYGVITCYPYLCNHCRP